MLPDDLVRPVPQHIFRSMGPALDDKIRVHETDGVRDVLDDGKKRSFKIDGIHRDS
jgi:hypothetical protein